MSEPRDLLDLIGDPDRQYVSPVPATARHRRQRAWLACVLVLAIGLPALVVTLGYNRPTATAEAMAAPATTTSSIRDTTSKALATESTKRTTTTAIETTTSTTAAPTTVSTVAPTSTTAYATTSTTAYAYTAVQAQAAPPTTVYVAPTTTTAYVAPTTAPPAQGEAAFLACVRQRESGGNYGAVSGDGLYRGAYQFHQATWDNVARMAGRYDLVGVPANLAAPADQDLLAVTLYRAAGAAPWGGSCA